MAIGDVYRLTIQWSNAPGLPTAVNQLYFKQDGGLIADTPEEDLVGAWQEEVEAAYASLVTNALAIRSYTVAKAPLFLTSLIVSGLAVGGSASGDAMPPQTAGVIEIRTADFSRRGRGRVFIPPGAESFNSAGKPTGAYRTSLGDVAANIKDDMASTSLSHTGWVWQLWSRADQAAKEVTTAFGGSFWGTQRDRNRLY
jgi:hypothetical protein